jgi:hypothetical protein
MRFSALCGMIGTLILYRPGRRDGFTPAEAVGAS